MSGNSKREKLIVFILFMLIVLNVMNAGQVAFKVSTKYLILCAEHDIMSIPRSVRHK